MSARRRARAGDILLEVLVAIAVFAAGAALLLVTARESLAALERADRRERAVDLARSAIARLEIGEINVADLRAGRSGPEEGQPWGAERFTIDARTERSEWSGLLLVEVRVRDADQPADAPPLCTLRQLVRTAGESGDDGAAAGGTEPVEPDADSGEGT